MMDNERPAYLVEWDCPKCAYGCWYIYNDNDEKADGAMYLGKMIRQHNEYHETEHG